METVLSPELLQLLIALGPVHMAPIYRAMRAAGSGLTIIEPGCGEIILPSVPAFVALVEDVPAGRGPAGYHLPSLGRLIRAANGILILACDPIPLAYAEAAAIAQQGGAVLIIRTSPQHEAGWFWFADALAAGRPVISVGFAEEDTP